MRSWCRCRTSLPALNSGQKRISQNSWIPAGKNSPSPATMITISSPGRLPFRHPRLIRFWSDCVPRALPQAGPTSPGRDKDRRPAPSAPWDHPGSVGNRWNVNDYRNRKGWPDHKQKGGPECLLAPHSGNRCPSFDEEIS